MLFRSLEEDGSEGELEVVNKLLRGPMRIEYFQRSRTTMERVHSSIPLAEVASSIETMIALAKAKVAVMTKGASSRFEEIDTDKNGQVSLDEFTKAMEGSSYSSEEVAQLFADIDTGTVEVVRVGVDGGSSISGGRSRASSIDTIPALDTKMSNTLLKRHQHGAFNCVRLRRDLRAIRNDARSSQQIGRAHV